ncbi:hypothetical protein DMA11_20725 [Marinilabiliaceae bacterium JC017]|nr:hypothetical protein DMA11_20725 [Marinilabiliaceae bacterium JC017]
MHSKSTLQERLNAIPEKLNSFITKIKNWFENLRWPLFVWRFNWRFLVALIMLSGGYAGALILLNGWGMLADIIIGAIVGVLGLLLFWLGIRFAVYLIRKTITKRTALFLSAALVLPFLLFGSPEYGLLLSIVIVTCVGAISSGLAWLVYSDFSHLTLFRKLSISIFSLAGLSGVIAFFVWWHHPGSLDDLTKVDLDGYPQIETLSLSDPSTPGDYEVSYLTYGSGKDRREAYGENVAIQTDSVNAKPFVDEMSGFLKIFRKEYWGFDRTAWPINGRVWYPAGEGAFPLVLIVHGNHHMRDYSDPGYEYLGQLLASRGYILVSVDENFLNGDWAGYYNNENDARGWLLLEHLRNWRNWNSDASNPFFGKVDMNKIALIGHSRGGEAVAVAAAFNRLSFYPDDARIRFDYDFNIQSVVAIAPIDGQYKPSKQSTPLENINYLLLQGSHDSDLFFFSGDRQYKRIRFTDDNFYFKTSIYAYRANHGQFNTSWGNRDYGLPLGYLLNTKPLLDGEEQRTISKVYISAFLDATLMNKHEYLPMFQDYRLADNWLPDTYFINRYEDANTHIMVDFEEDIDVTSTTIVGGSIEGYNLATWREADLGLRDESSKRQNKVVFLGWDYTRDSVEADSLVTAPLAHSVDTLARYVIHLPDEVNAAFNRDSAAFFTLALAEVDEKPAEPLALDKVEEDANNGNVDKEQDEVKEEKKEDEELRQPLNFSFVFKDQNGQEAMVTMKMLLPLMPPLKATFARLDKLEEIFKKDSEPTLQTIHIPLVKLKEINPEFEPGSIRSVEVWFNDSPKGVIALDEISVR